MSIYQTLQIWGQNIDFGPQSKLCRGLYIMKFPLSWLKEFLPIHLSSDALAERLTLLGIEVEAIEEVENDTLFDVALTPNFGHAMSIWGLAREIGAHLNKKIQLPPSSVIEDSSLSVENFIEVAIESPACPFYTCRVVMNIDSLVSPPEIQDKLQKVGFKSVNLVVDITQLVMVELGIPLHAFDYDSLSGKQLTVRAAKNGEETVTIDHVARKLSEANIVVADGEKIVAIAGVMGCKTSEIGTNSQRVLIESAFFDPKSIRRSSKSLGLATEASRRFERGVDIDAIKYALNRAVHLIQHYSPLAQVAKAIACKSTQEPKKRYLTLRSKKIEQILGLNFSMGELETLFARLGFKIKEQEAKFLVEIPSFRTDITSEIDLVEEIARLYGYNNLFIKGNKPIYHGSRLEANPLAQFEKKVRNSLLSEGLSEWLSCDLVNENKTKAILGASLPDHSMVRLINPHSKEQSLLRPSLLVNHLDIVKHNIDHGILTLAAFEVARIHFSENGLYREPLMAAITLSGNALPFHFESKSRSFDFFDLKGIVENLLDALKVGPFRFERANHTAFHPTQQAKILVNDVEVGILGQIHPKALQIVGIGQPLFFAELSIEQVRPYQRIDYKMKPCDKLPSSRRDWTITVAQDLNYATLSETLWQVAGPLLEESLLIDIFESDKIGRGWKNVTLRFSFRAEGVTLSQTQVEEEFSKLKSETIARLNNQVKDGA